MRYLLATCLTLLCMAFAARAQEDVEVIDVSEPPKIETEVMESEPVQEIEEPEIKSGKAEKQEELPPEINEEATTDASFAVLQGLNKVTGRISRLEGAVGSVMKFENLEIIPHRCWKSPPDERPESAVLIEIREMKKDEPPRRVFMGWMFASSPGLSGLEHPVYDVTALACELSAPLPAHPAPVPPEKKPENAPKKPK